MASKAKRRSWKAKVKQLPGAFRRHSVKWGRQPHWSSREWREAIAPQKVSYRTWDGLDGKEVFHIKVSRDLIAGAGRHLHLLLCQELLERGLIRPSRCECSHCAADYDCCGRIIGGPVRATRIKGRTFRVEQVIFTNI